MKLIIGLIAVLAWVGLIVGAVAGWVMNIIAVVHAPVIAQWGGLEIARLIGIVIAPVGAILGWL